MKIINEKNSILVHEKQKQIKQIKQKGFTLVEVVIAIAIIGLLLTGVVAVLAPATDDIDDSLTKIEAQKIVDIFVAEMNIMRGDPTEPNINVDAYDQWAATQASYGNPSTPYEKAFTWCDMGESNKKDEAVIVYFCNVDPKVTTKENLFKPVNINSSVDFPTTDPPMKGVNYIVQPRVRRRSAGQIALNKELDAGFSSGKAYLLRFKGYQKKNGELHLMGYGKLRPEGDADGDGVIPKINPDPSAGDDLGLTFSVQVEVYKLRSNGSTFVTSVDPADYKDEKGKIRPLYKTNIAFRR